MSEEFKCKLCCNVQIGNVFQMRGKCVKCTNEQLLTYFQKLQREKLESESGDNVNLLRRYLSQQIIAIKSKRAGREIDKNNLMSSSEEEKSDEKDEDFVPETPSSSKLMTTTRSLKRRKARSRASSFKLSPPSSSSSSSFSSSPSPPPSPVRNNPAPHLHASTQNLSSKSQPVSPQTSPQATRRGKGSFPKRKIFSSPSKVQTQSIADQVNSDIDSCEDDELLATSEKKIDA